MEYIEVINKTYEYVDALKNTKEYQQLLMLKKEIDYGLKDLIKNFKDAEQKYREALKFGKYHPDLAKYQVEFSKAKEILFSNELVQEYKKLEGIIQANLNELVQEIKKNISKKFKTNKLLNN